jgi:hypothetical protein
MGSTNISAVRRRQPARCEGIPANQSQTCLDNCGGLLILRLTAGEELTAPVGSVIRAVVCIYYRYAPKTENLSAAADLCARTSFQRFRGYVQKYLWIAYWTISIRQRM